MGGHRADTGEDPVDGTVDLAAVRADDALLDAVHGRHAGAVESRADEELVALLATWQAEVDARPLPELISLDEAVAAVESGRGDVAGRRAGPHLLRRVSLVAAAAIALALVGFGSAVHNALPGQPLFGVSKVVFSDRADSLERADAAQEALTGADAAIVGKDLARAQSLLEGADDRIETLRPQEKATLEAELDRVRSSLTPQAPVPAVPGADARSASAGTSATTSPTTTAPTTATATSTRAPAVPSGGTAASTPGSGTGTTTTTTTTTTTRPPLSGG